MKIMTVFGTRPEAIKMAPLVKELESRDNIESIVCVTAQHREMLDQVLDVFNIKVNYDLNIMKSNQSLSQISTNIMNGLDKVIKEVKPDIILVHGDTTTTFISSLVAFYNQVKVGHVEAGLRTYNKYSPFPEELNRQLTSVIADIHFAPTEKSKDNLIKEGKNPEKIYITGNTAIDALKTTIDKEYKSEITDKIGKNRMILLTCHRRENLGSNMKNIFKAVNKISMEFDDVEIVYPIHFNPQIRDLVKEEFKGNKKVHVIEPLSVVEFHNLLNKSYLILTDSGGIQEEAPFLGKPVLVLRETTERPEGIKAKILKLVGTNEENIYKYTKELLTNKKLYNEMSKASNPYGDGLASKYIVDIIEKIYQN
ncbi:non-hydrolyzing UDP-N-acetylglucosamine 2-epimerase [Romboutsia hominis]|uniref:UDP-N-acetylglucosamine 2-epimerase (non-hydrolyzing) n=1 Tax=Romboutsia hominis TaxID=1507512 RepID=A0A2P2BSG9_9FIRM|nr:UDP-N-acetylglucosamine 2-epimerase (non-hydrolyzing) [Romboutsia hominis]CEI73272.1 UDP-N-acetylglucosamine 2-epimerase [Romboutsia hominis]